MTQTINDQLRNGDLATLTRSLEDISTRAVDVVLAGRQLTFSGGLAVVQGVSPVLSEDGVTEVNGSYRPTLVGQEGLATKLDIPVGYLRRTLAQEHAELADANLNYWLSRNERTFMLRLLRGAGSEGVLRAFLSDRYFTIDNLDVVIAALQGVQAAGLDPGSLKIEADLSLRRMYLRITSTQIAANATALVRHYTDPKSRRTGADYPTVNAGLRISNSEVGQGGFSVTPYATFLVCSNGMTWTKDALTKVHLGGRLDEGAVQWSRDTQDKALALVTAQTRDAVAAFMSVDYLNGKITEMERAAGVVVDEPATVIDSVSRKVGFSNEQSASILNAFIDGGQRTAGGVMQAVTYVAQHHPDADVASDMQDKAVEALQLAATASR